MNTLDYILIAALLFNLMLTWIYTKISDEQEINLLNNWENETKRTNEWIAMYDGLQNDFNQLSKQYQATKAELEQYKNHESETAKVIKPIGKKVTVSTDGAGMGAKASFEVFGLNTELVNDPHNVRYTFWYKGNRYLGYEVVDSKILAYPLSKPVITEAGKNVETFLEF